MITIRAQALEKVLQRQPYQETEKKINITGLFGKYVFDRQKMQQYLSGQAFLEVMDAIENGTRINHKMADQVAVGMKAWALKMGATHYTHWFHPLTEGTAEKHDSFTQFSPEGHVIEKFSGELLTQQEPDSSELSGGGLRNTFEARGYTAWDPSSPAFIIDNTLSIPTIFISFTGEALDYKTPLLKSLHILDQAATGVCQMVDKEVTNVRAMLGWEQEYYLVDEALYFARPDLGLTERTLMGHTSAREHQLANNYFSSIPSRVFTFMRDFEKEAYKLGIPIKTHHNEVAPNQFEVASLHEECNLSVDHNLLLMDIMKRVAYRHAFRVVFHEKPFKGVHGSGKHNNWSLATNTGVNLLAPGDKPKSNLLFLTFLLNVVMAVYKNQDLFRASIASSGNVERLGVSEAPPVIVSVFIGSQLSAILAEIENRVTNNKMTPDEKTELKLDIGKIPEILTDNTDHNRTSPFAFTGNRLELRAVGSSANCASPMIVLNTAIADQLIQFTKEVDNIIDKGVKKDEAILRILRNYIIESKPIRYEGNNYTSEWIEEARQRKLSNIPNVVDAINAYKNKNTIALFKRSNVFTDNEVIDRTDIKLENYVRKIVTESKVLGDLAINHIVPVAIDYQSRLIENVQGLRSLFSGAKLNELTEARMELIVDISGHIAAIKSKVTSMSDARKKAETEADVFKRARYFSLQVFPFLNDIRFHIDKLELVVDDKIWPLPKYRELLFSR
ncbi:MAG: glutamine synthetase type III [Bacteroidetes bacterium]|jgi:glutamine synthetase|nr:glutamine synthetase type III [Bacteroidota bacterium]